MTKIKLGITAIVVAGAATTLLIQYQSQNKLRHENEALQQQVSQLQSLSEALANQPVPQVDSKSLSEEQLKELMKLRGQVGVLRRETNELGKLLAAPRLGQPGNVNDPNHPYPLPEDYPKTADGATRGIFEEWSRGDWGTFFTNFAEPGVPPGGYDHFFHDPARSNALVGMQIVSVGQPTNSPGSSEWYVPYTVQFNGNSLPRSGRLHVAQDPNTQRWFFRGGF
jgi:hypothetical protein